MEFTGYTTIIKGYNVIYIAVFVVDMMMGRERERDEL